MPEPRARPLALPALVLALALAGCSHTFDAHGARTLRLAVTEYRFNPQRAHVIAGTLTIVVRNYGRLSHNLVVSRDGQTQGSTKAIPPGQSAELTVTLTPGSYQIFSTILDDQALGEYGTLSVT